MLRRAGRARDADHRRAGPGFRRRRDDARARGGKEKRTRHGLARANPGGGHPRNPGGRAPTQGSPRAAPALARCRPRVIIAPTMPTTREVLQATIALEKRSMALYARFAKTFATHPRLHEFWFGMARDEARHVGALDLVATVLDFEGMLDRPSPVALDDATVARLAALLERGAREAASGLAIERALALALEVEETELEDNVGDLLKALQQQDAYQRCIPLL